MRTTVFNVSKPFSLGEYLFGDTRGTQVTVHKYNMSTKREVFEKSAANLSPQNCSRQTSALARARRQSLGLGCLYNY